MDQEIRGDKLTPEWSFTAGHENEEPQGIKAHLKFIKANINDPETINLYLEEISRHGEVYEAVTLDDTRASSLLKQVSLATNKEIMKAARGGDKFAIAMVKNLAFRWGSFLNEQLKHKLQEINYTKLVITGSHIVDMLNISPARHTFIESLFRDIQNEPEIVTVDKAKMDGMPELLRITAAQAAKGAVKL